MKMRGDVLAIHEEIPCLGKRPTPGGVGGEKQRPGVADAADGQAARQATVSCFSSFFFLSATKALASG